MEVPPITVEAEPVPGSTSAPELYRLETVVPQVRETRDTFERQPNDRASDVIGRMPGVIIGGPPGEKKAVNLRGLGPDFNRIDVNGVQLPSSTQSRSFELMNLPAFLVQDIAIIRNPSAEYEGDGIAGRIAVTTRAIPREPTLEVRGGFGGVNDQWQENRQANLGYGQRLHNRFGFMGAINYDRRLILKVKDFSELTFSGGPGGQGFLRDEFEPKIFENLDLFLDLGYFYSGGEVHLKPLSLRETIDLEKQRDQFRRVTGQFQDRTLTIADEETETVGLTVEQTHRLGAGFELKAHAGYFHTGFDSTSNDTTLNSALAFANGAWVTEHDDHLTASVKKQGPDDRPALAESFDGGETWQLTAMEDYNDNVLAEGRGLIVTRSIEALLYDPHAQALLIGTAAGELSVYHNVDKLSILGYMNI